MNTSTLRDDAKTTTDPVQLAAQARLAYEQKQTRECIALVRQLLAVDEDNMDARVLQDAIRSDIQRDFEDARALLEDSRTRDDGQKYRKAAEIILLKILYLDPAHADAKALLSSVKGGMELPRSTAVYSEAPRRRAADDELAFTAQPEPVEEVLESGRRHKIPLILLGPVFALVLAGVFYFKSPAPVDSVEPATSTASLAVKPPTSLPSPANSAATLETTLAPTNAKPADPAPVPAVQPRLPTAADALPPPPTPTPVVVTGSLAVSSSVAADIYMGDKYLGTTPATLQFSAGRYTLEYRHGDLRTVMTHDIKSRRTTTVAVPFETTVQINARPWAQVFLEGTARQALGQTPLSSVRVPVGSVLTFENPNFLPKSHRVTATDSSIQMAFP